MTTASPPATELTTAPPTTEVIPTGKHMYINNIFHKDIDYNIPVVPFEIPPLPLTVAVEQEVATFYCQHLSCDIIAWRVNGTLLNRINSPNIRSSSSGTIRLLSIGTLPEYNGTTVECVAFFFDGTPPLPTLPVTLLIQGIYVIVYILICPLPLFCEQIRVFLIL